MRHRFLGPAWAACVLLAGPLVHPVAAQGGRDDQMQAPEVAELEFDGVRAVDEDELRASIATDASHCKSLLLTPLCWVTKSHYVYEREYLDRTELARDVLRIRVFYWRRGYRDTAVDTAVTEAGDDRVAVRFRVTEGEPTVLSGLRVVVPDTIGVERAVEPLRAMEGQPFDLVALDSLLVNLRAALWGRGYADAEISDTIGVIAGQRRAEVVVAVEPGPLATVDSIVVRGNEQVDEETIRNSLALRGGEVFRRDEIAESQRSLYESGLFASAVVSVPGGQDSSKVVYVDVVEAPLHAARIAGGGSNVEFVQAEASWTDYNFLGGARRLQLSGALGNLFARQLQDVPGFLQIADLVGPGESADPYLRPNWQAAADFNQRWFRDYRNSLGANVFARRRSVPGVYVDVGYGASATFTRALAPRAPLSLTYRFEIARIENASDVYFCVITGVCDEPTIAALQGSQRLSPLALSGNIDRSNDVLSPTRGYRASAALEHASGYTFSDFRYNRINGEGSYYRPVGERSVLAFRGRIGWVRALESTLRATGVQFENAQASVHPRKRFYAGGASSVRGFAENQLGPRVLTIPPAGADDTTGFQSTCVDQADFDACSALLARLDPERFTPRPIGGTSIIEANVEFRFPIWGDELQGAAFIDGALLGNGNLTDIAAATGAITPGIGVRYFTPVGPVRVDVGWRPQLTQTLSVYTERTVAGRNQLMRIGRVDYESNPGGSVLDQLVLHFSIGQAF